MGRAWGPSKPQPEAVGHTSRRVGAGRLSRDLSRVCAGREKWLSRLRAPRAPSYLHLPRAPRTLAAQNAGGPCQRQELRGQTHTAQVLQIPGRAESFPAPNPSCRPLMRVPGRTARRGEQAPAGTGWWRVWRLREGTPRGGIKASNKEHRPHPAVG